MSTTTANLGLFKYDITNPTDLAAAFNINTALNNNWDKIDEAISNSGGARNIGEIVSSTVPLTDAGLHLLDGSLIQGSGIYSAFVTYIAGLDLTANYFCTESDWQQSITDYGVCGKFVYDSVNNTVRLPKVTGILEGTTDLTALGDLVEAGLPNITGTFSPWAEGGRLATGAFYVAANNQPGTSSGGDNDNTLFGFDASRSSSIYGNSSTVQPQTIKAFYYIVIATSTKTAIKVDIDTIATDLNGKVDKSDLQEVQCVIEAYQNGYSWYRIYSDGWCEQGGTVPYESGVNEVSITYMKPYKEIPNLQLSAITTNAGYINAVINAWGISKTGFTKQYHTVVGNGWSWRACGYII